nr:retrovirus-related Pol polyprotein from transposon TNT 1-94 [Tanacetum cinerariifolium]
MVAILEKSDAAEGFEQIIDFLSGSYINHALTVKSHVYISCIKQFWNTVVVKRSGDVTRLQALVDKKRIVITEEVVREIMQLNDVEGVICLPNEEIFAGLARMGYEKASTKLTFYKAFFSTQWKLPSIGFMRPFGCHVTILNTLDPLSKFQGKVDERFLVGYSVCSKAFRVFNSRTSIVQETLHVNFMENKLNVAGAGPAWLFDIDSLTQAMNYHPVLAENQTNSHAGFQDTEKAGEEETHTYVLFRVLSDGSTNPQNNNKDALVDGKEHDDI